MAKLQTQRLTLRPFRKADADRFAQLAGDWAVASMTSDIPFPFSAKQAQLWLRHVHGEVRFAVEHQGQLIGGVGFYRRPSGTAELGFWLGREWWGQGFATEAAQAVVRYGFRNQRVPAFTSAHFVDNAASRNVLAKLGFEPVQHCEIICVARGVDVRAVTYGLEQSKAVGMIPGLEAARSPFEAWRARLVRVWRSLERPKQPTSSTP